MGHDSVEARARPGGDDVKPERGETRERSDDPGGGDKDLALCGDGLELDQPVVAHERIRRQYSAALGPLPAH